MFDKQWVKYRLMVHLIHFILLMVHLIHFILSQRTTEPQSSIYRITVIILMLDWRLTAAVKECNGIVVNPELQYALLLKLGNRFSAPLAATQASRTGVLFNSSLELELTTTTDQLPATQMQLLLVGVESMLSPRGINTRKQQIMAIATLPISYPLQQTYAVPTRYKFDKPADSKANIRVSFSLTRQNASPKSQRSRSPSPSLSPKHGRLNGVSPSKRRDEEYEEVIKERNQLYKMSEGLYEQLKKCMAERDQYLRELREKELSEEQIREQMEFLKLKLQEEHTEQHEHSPLLQEIQELRQQNEQMRAKLTEREADLKELQRRVKESLIAMDEFRREAVMARTDLIHKESQLSLISKHTKYLDPAQCIQELYRQLQNRRLEQPFWFEEDRYELHSPSAKAVERLKLQVMQTVTKLMGRLKGKDKEWLMQEKVNLERKIEEIFNQC